MAELRAGDERRGMRALALAVSCSVVAVLSACGDSSSTPGAAPPPSPDPGGTPTTAEPSPEPPSGPSPTPGPPPTPDRFVDVERLDPHAECDALVPAQVPAPVTATIAAPPRGDGGCGRGVSDGTGHVAALVRSTPRGAEWQVFAPGGSARETFTITSDLWPQPEGWQGVQAATSGNPSSLTLLTFFADGSPRRSEQPQGPGFGPPIWAVAPQPLGGSVVAAWGPPAESWQAPCLGTVRRYDATGAPAGPAGRTACGIRAVGVSKDGETLVLEGLADGTGRTQLRWLRSDGTLAAPPSQDVPHVFGQLLPLLDGSLVLLQGDGYVRRYPRLAPRSEPAPAWLAARTGQTFRFTRGNGGYAFFPAPGAPTSDCTQAVELVAPSGRRCAKLTFRRDGNGCTTGSIDQGWDGSVVQQGAQGACSWRTWPRLLAGP
jgi:hypothetical protein